MATTFFERVADRARSADTLLCVGLDPHLSDLPRADAAAALDFSRRLVERTADLAVAFKPNAAFFERFGAAGVDALRALIAFIPNEVPVLLDVKRGDIASTAEAYASAAFDWLGADAVTINPLLGRDAVEPFIGRPERGAFVLCKTSNPGSADLQDSWLWDAGGPRRLFERVAALANGWNERDNVGLVVGATHPEALAAVRAIAPHLWLLTPGVGAQGGDLGAALSVALRRDGLGVIVPVSRGISRADDPRAAALALRDRINEARVAAMADSPGPALPTGPERLADALVDSGCVRFGQFTLKSGAVSPIYIDLRRLIADPLLLGQVAEAYLPLLAGLDFDHVAALPYAALPIGTAVALAGGLSLVYPRREAKGYGTRAAVEGVYQPGQRVVVLDDLATTGGSKIEAIEKLNAVDLVAEDIVVLVDRESGARETLTDAGLKFHAVFTLGGLLDHWLPSGRVTPEQARDVRRFVAASRPA